MEDQCMARLAKVRKNTAGRSWWTCIGSQMHHPRAQQLSVTVCSTMIIMIMNAMQSCWPNPLVSAVKTEAFRAKNRARRNGVQLGLVADPPCPPPNRRRFQQVFQSHQLVTSNLISQASRKTTGKKRKFFRSFHHCSRSRFLPLKTLSVSSSPDRLKNRRIFNRTYSSARLCNLH